MDRGASQHAVGILDHSEEVDGETPFSMNYGAEAMIPMEVGLPTSWTNPFEVEENNCLSGRHLDLIKENRKVTSIKLANYQQRICCGYNKGVKCWEFILGDLVLKKVLGNTRNPTWGKLGPNWEGLYLVSSITRTGAYRLKDLDERPVARPWNVFNLKKYYFNWYICKHCILYPLRLEPPFPNDVEILKPKVGLRPNQI